MQAAEPAGDAFLGVDLGTQGVRAVLVDASGSVLGEGHAPLRSHTGPDGRHEQDPQQWWAATCAATRLALAGSGRRPAAVSIDSTSGTFVVVDAAGVAVGPALMYDDARGRGETERARSAGADLWERLGHRPQPTWALPRLAHLARTGELAGRRVAHQADHVGARLTGHPVATDVSHVLKTGYDQVGLRWPDELLAGLGIDPAQLPAVVAAGTTVGVVSAAAAAESGIPTGTPLRAGTTDGCAAQVAAAALQPGDWCCSLGTTLVLKGATEELLHDPSGAVYSHRNPDGGWLPGGASSTGAGVLAREFGGADLVALTARAARLGPPDPVTYPLAGSGERFPFVAPDAHGFGMDPAAFAGSPDPEAARFSAVLHGVAYVEGIALDVLAGIGADTSGEITLAGGASRNRWWNQLRADVLGRPVVVRAHTDAALGSAVVAAAPPGELAATARRMTTVRQRLSPDPDRSALLAEGQHRLAAELADRGWLAARTAEVLGA